MSLNLIVNGSLSSEIQNVTDQNGNQSGLYLGQAPPQSITGTICAGATTVSGLDVAGSYMPMNISRLPITGRRRQPVWRDPHKGATLEAFEPDE